MEIHLPIGSPTRLPKRGLEMNLLEASCFLNLMWVVFAGHKVLWKWRKFYSRAWEEEEVS